MFTNLRVLRGLQFKYFVTQVSTNLKDYIVENIDKLFNKEENINNISLKEFFD